MKTSLNTNKVIFDDLHPPLSKTVAVVEADRCYFCHDAPCTTACPTGIDIPLFIQKIRSDNRTGSARTILSENIMGAMCARVCPTEILCEDACVRNHEEHAKPVEIGALQRYATDSVIENKQQLFERGTETGKHVVVVGAGPAGLSCAHRLSMFGHFVTVFEARDKVAGLNEYGIAAYKATNNIAALEAQYILDIGGIEVKTKQSLGKNFTLESLRNEYDAVFLSPGLANTRQLNIEGEDLTGVIDAVDYIADLRQNTIDIADSSENTTSQSIADNIVVIGGGMTAIDVAVQSKLLGAKEVTIAYRRDQEHMGASIFEQELALTHGVAIKYCLSPLKVLHENGIVEGVEFEEMTIEKNGSMGASGNSIVINAEVVFKAIGQVLVSNELDVLTLESGRIVVDESRRTSLSDVWAGGDCVLGGDNLTVSAVQDGKLAAISINHELTEKEST